MISGLLIQKKSQPTTHNKRSASISSKTTGYTAVYCLLFNNYNNLKSYDLCNSESGAIYTLWVERCLLRVAGSTANITF